MRQVEAIVQRHTLVSLSLTLITRLLSLAVIIHFYKLFIPFLRVRIATGDFFLQNRKQ